MSDEASLAERRQLTALAARVFPGLALGLAPFGEVSLKPEEEAAVAKAIPARRAEFSAGRAAARLALGRDVAIPMAEDRAPLWPAGVSGSITHAGGWALAVTGSGLIGADLESDRDLPAEVRNIVLRPEERGADARRARLIFSAKECAYKAQYPVTRVLFDFHSLSVTLSDQGAGEGQFLAEFQRDVGVFRRGALLQGRFAIGGGFILTGISLPDG